MVRADARIERRSFGRRTLPVSSRQVDQITILRMRGVRPVRSDQDQAQEPSMTERTGIAILIVNGLIVAGAILAGVWIITS